MFMLELLVDPVIYKEVTSKGNWFRLLQLAQDLPKTAQDSSKTPQDVTRQPQDGSMMAPRWPQDGPKMAPRFFQLPATRYPLLANLLPATSYPLPATLPATR